MAAGAVRDRFGTVHPAGPRLRSGVCYYLPMAIRLPRSKAAKATQAAPVAAKVKAAVQAAQPEAPAPEPEAIEAEAPEAIEARTSTDHDEEW